MFKRFLDEKLPEQSFFLFGPRQVGKSTLLKKHLTHLIIDLLDPETQLAYNKKPTLLKNQLQALQSNSTILIDEIQRVPKLLDVVHEAMEQRPDFRFILCGSSARKLRHGASNLLGGRALYRTLHTLNVTELGEQFNLDSVLTFGSLPKITSTLLEGKTELARDFLRAYVITYLQEEIKAEALVRNLQDFQNFLDIAAAQFGEQVNFGGVARNCQVALSTVRGYYSILEDTLIGILLKPYHKSERKRMSHQPKFYFFDNGVTRAIRGTLKDPPPLSEMGRLFEQWFIQEVIKINDYLQKDWKLSFWRTSHGAEVDLLISRGEKILYAIELKFTPRPSTADLSGLRSFHENHPSVPCYLTAPIKLPMRLSFVEVLPPEQLLKKL